MNQHRFTRVALIALLLICGGSAALAQSGGVPEGAVPLAFTWQGPPLTRPGASNVPPDSAQGTGLLSSAQLAEPPGSREVVGAWGNVFTETFEGAFPGSNWTLTGDPTWNDVSYAAHTGAWSGWCAGSSLNPAGGYPNNMNAWMIYGPFSLADAKAAQVQFWYKNNSEANFDYFGWAQSTNGVNFYGYQISGDQSAWSQVTFDLTNIAGSGQVWIMFRFISDSTISGLPGAYVDDIVISKDTAPDLTPYQRPNWNDKIPVGITLLPGTDNHTYNGPYYDNQALYFNWSVINQGSAAADPFRVHVEVTGTGGGAWNWDFAGAFPAGSTGWLTNDQPVGPLSAGSHTFKVWVDYLGAVAESIETNNYYERTINVVSPLPDLTPELPATWNDRIPIGITQLGYADPHTYPGPYYDNQVLYVNWSSFNQGAAPAGSYTVHAEVTGTGGGVFNWTCASTGVGTWCRLSSDQAVGPLAAGTHTFKLWLDYYGTVVEANEGNNYYERTITVTALPDLTPYQRPGWNDKIPIGITQLPGGSDHTYTGPYYDSQTLYFNWASLNQGTGTTGVAYRVHAEVTGTGGGVFNWDVPAIPPGSFTYLSTDQAVGPLAAGSHTFKVWVDYLGAVTEANETNNYYERTINVTGSTRIIGLSGNLAFGDVSVGSTATRTLTISNTGSSTLTVTGITYPAGFSGAWSGTIPAGGSQPVTVTFAPTAGTAYGGTVTVNSDKTSGTNTIAASGTGIARVIGLSGNLAFGDVNVGSTATRTLTISNTGNGTLTVTGITYPPGFSGPWSGTIPAGGSQPVTVTFAPTAVMAYGGTVTVLSDKTSGTNTIPASGNGVAGSIAERDLPACYSLGGVVVTIHILPVASVLTYAVEETPPAGWVASEISHSGIWDAGNQKVKWGPFFDNAERTLSYKVTPPGGATGPKTFSGLASFDGYGQTIGGETTIADVCQAHPADQDMNFHMVINEVTAYGAAWRSGAPWDPPPSPIEIDYLTRAGFLWRSGEAYWRDPALPCPLCWVPLTTSMTAAVERAVAAGAPAWTNGTAVRNLDGRYRPGMRKMITIAVTPDAYAQAWAVEETVPPGWLVTSVSDGGHWDELAGQVRWGPFFDNLPRTLSYAVAPPEGFVGTATFRGTCSFDGLSAPVTGRARAVLDEVRRPR